MIRPDLLKAVLDTLDSHRYLSREDFLVNEGVDRSQQVGISIQYRYSTDMEFHFTVPTQRIKNAEGNPVYRFSCRMKPGHEAVEEVLVADGRSELLDELKNWLKRLHADLISAPLARQLQEHAEALERFRERLSVLPEDPISRSEVSDFEATLEQFKAELSEQLKQHVTEKEELKAQLDLLTRDVEFLKQTLSSMTKRQWGELLAARVMRWKDKLTLKNLSAGARILKLLLPESAEEPLKSIAATIDAIVEAVEEESTPPTKR